jgi:hypothetical protein
VRATSFYEHYDGWQIQLVKNVYALPNITRDSIATREKRAARRESKPAPDLRVAGK